MSYEEAWSDLLDAVDLHNEDNALYSSTLYLELLKDAHKQASAEEATSGGPSFLWIDIMRRSFIAFTLACVAAVTWWALVDIE